MGFLSRLFGKANLRVVDRLQPTIQKINALEKDFEKLSDSALKEKTTDLQKRLNSPAGGKASLDDILPEAFALVREAAKRTLGQRHFDEQLLGGIVLHQGKIAEMKTGEGKTLVATLPLYLNSLSGQGSHLVTVNDYLARRDAGWMGPIYHLLGVSVAAIGHEVSYLYNPAFSDPSASDEQLAHLQPIARQEAYKADVTYGTNNEFGFDYLRDNMAGDILQLAQRPFNFGIVDEVDSILIDEARTPLIISAPAEESAGLYRQFAELVPRLKKDEDYLVDEKMHAVTLTDAGIKKMEEWLGVDNIYETRGIQMVHHLEEALKALALFQKDKDYVVKDGEVVIVDEFTGRLMPGRRYSEGLHQAIEAKEGVEVKRESDTLATISFQNLFRMYPKLAGMTGTAATEAEEFYKIYGLEVVEIPTHRPMIRLDRQDKIYKTEEGKFQAVVAEIKTASERGQPVLVGTIAIEKSEVLSAMLKREGVKHEVLNAKNHEREAKIIAQAGAPGAVTVATNMAGRGVDIVLGGKPPQNLKSQNSNLKTWEKQHQRVIEAGGLYVIGTERHEARRIDNQLRGRSGRQGDPGLSQFYASMEDDLMRIFGGERMKGMMERLGLPDDQSIEHKLISRSIEQAQKKVEGHNFDLRKHLVEYDDVANKHRESIYRKRRRILELDPQKDSWLHQEILEMMPGEVQKDFQEKIKKYGEGLMRQVEKMVYLRVIDMMWVQHLNAMDELREGVGLRGYGQRDPLVEYKQEAYNLFQRLKSSVEDEVVNLLLRVEIQAPPREEASLIERRPVQMQGADEAMAGGGGFRGQMPEVGGQMAEPEAARGSGVTVTVRQRSAGAPATPTTTSAFPKVGRNEPCPCGSGKKYKKCHGR